MSPFTSKFNMVLSCTLTSVLGVSCGDIDFNGNNPAEKTQKEERATPAEQEAVRSEPTEEPFRPLPTQKVQFPSRPAQEPTVLPSRPPGEEPPPLQPPLQPPSQPASELCSGNSPLRRILVLDLKSGWFAGDGGETFRTLIPNECSERFEVSYAHVTQEKIETNFRQAPSSFNLFPCLDGLERKEFVTDDCLVGSMNAFQQIWILSGSYSDPSDVRPGAALYDRLISRVEEAAASNSQLSLFFGAGLGNVDHANSIGSLLLAAPLFSLRSGTFPAGVNPSPAYVTRFRHSPLLPTTQTPTAGTFLKTHPVFASLNALFDFEKEPHFANPSDGSQTPGTVNIGECFSDRIRPNAQFQLIAKDHCGEAVAASGQVGLRRVYLEGNMTRFYSSEGRDYFNQILLYLARPIP